MLALAGAATVIAIGLVLFAQVPRSLAAACDAPTKTWDGGAGTDLWNDHANWSPHGAPAATDDVCVSANITIEGIALSRSFEVVSGSTLTIVDGARLSAAGPGESSIDPAATLSAAGDVVGGAGGSSPLTNTGTIHLSADAQIAVPFTNADPGVVRSTSTGITVVAETFTNAGAVHVTAGTLRVAGAGTSSGSVVVDAGATLFHTGSGFTYGPTASISGTGGMTVGGAVMALSAGTTYSLPELRVTVGTLTLVDDYTVEDLTLTGGTLTGPSNLTVTRALMQARPAVMTGGAAATTTVASGATATLATATGSLVIGRTLSLAPGSTTVVDGNGAVSSAGGGIGSVTNGGSMTITGNSTLAIALTNAGTGSVNKTSTGITVVSGTFTNDGAVHAMAGILSLAGAFTNYNQTTDVLTGGQYHVLGTLRFSGADIVTNNATIVLDGSASLIVDPVGNDSFRNFTTNPGSLTITGGRTLTLTHALSSSGAIVVDPASALGAPSITLAGGTLSGHGTVVGPVTSSGTVLPGSSPGILTISGNYTQTAAGSLAIEIGGTTPGTGHDQFAITGAATLNGALSLSAIGGFEPSIGDTFAIVTYSSHSGCFTGVTGRDLGSVGAGMFFDVTCGPTAAIVEAKRAELSIGDVTVTEGDGVPEVATFTVSLNVSRPDLSITVDFATADGTALAGSDLVPPPGDYVAASGAETFPPGATSQLISVEIVDDITDEDNEVFTVELAGASNAAISDGSAVGTIVDDDAPPTISIGDAIMYETNVAQLVSRYFPIELSAPTERLATIDVTTTDGTATTPDDYLGRSGTVNITQRTTTSAILIWVVYDGLDEDDETFTGELSNPVNVTISDGSAVGTIIDDDSPPTVSIDDATLVEGDSGTAAAVFTVSLSDPSAKEVTVPYATDDGTATAPTDYVPTAGSVAFPPGVTAQTVTIDIVGDVFDEPDETFTVSLSGAINASILDAIGTGTITDDDVDVSTAAIDDVTLVEGASGTNAATFTVTLSRPRTRLVTVEWATLDVDALAGSDYVGASGMVTFVAGDVDEPIVVDVYGDTDVEADETFQVVLFDPVGTSIADGSGAATIVNDDVARLSIGDVTVAEGNSGTPQAAVTVTLSGPSTLPVTVDYSTADSSATSPADFAPASGRLTFDPGETAKEIRIDIVTDTLDEPNETFAVDLANPSNATLADTFAIVTITDDDPAPGLCIHDASVTEGDTGTTPIDFTICLASPSAKTITVDYATANGTALAGSDYTAVTGSLTFAPGQTTIHVLVAVRGDVADEANETFTLNLSNAVNATIPDPSGVGTILDDDPKPVITSFSPGSLPQGDTVTIRGSGFTGATQVAFARFGGGTVLATTFRIVNDTRVTATVPAGATTGKVSVTTPNGTGTGPVALLIQPKIVGFTPNVGPVGTTVTITGSGFAGATSVRFGGVATTLFGVSSDTQIIAIVPTGAPTGKITVVTPGGSDTSMGKFTVR